MFYTFRQESNGKSRMSRTPGYSPMEEHYLSRIPSLSPCFGLFLPVSDCPDPVTGRLNGDILVKTVQKRAESSSKRCRNEQKVAQNGTFLPKNGPSTGTVLPKNGPSTGRGLSPTGRGLSPTGRGLSPTGRGLSTPGGTRAQVTPGGMRAQVTPGYATRCTYTTRVCNTVHIHHPGM